MEEYELVKLLSSDLIRINYLDNNLLSINFKPKVFYNNLWDDMIIKARGLFLDKDTLGIRLRSYDKFFNYGEISETTYDYMVNNFNAPFYISKKENGFLGILSMVDDELIFATKSTTESEYVNIFKEIYYKIDDVNRKQIENLLKSKNVSITFEVISSKDRHIIDYYDKDMLFLLDIIENRFGSVYPIYSNSLKEKLNLVDDKYLEIVDTTITDLDIKDVISNILDRLDVEKIEGYILTDSLGRKVKFKTKFYLDWKNKRNFLNILKSQKNIDNRVDILKNSKHLDKNSRQYIDDEKFLKYLEENMDKLDVLDIIDIQKFILWEEV